MIHAVDDEDQRALARFVEAANRDGEALGASWPRVACAVRCETLDEAALRVRLDALHPDDGWRCWTDRVEWLLDGTWHGRAGGSDRLLSAEFGFDGGRRSVTVRHLHGDSWSWVEAVEGEGEPALKQTVAALATPAEPEDLRIVHAVYWRPDADGLLRPHASRFERFSRGEP